MKRRVALSVVLAVCFAAAMYAQVQYIAFEQIAIAGTAIGFTSTKISPSSGPQATTATCRDETAEIRYAYDGTTPTSSVGTLLEPGDLLILSGHDSLVRFLGIRTTTTSAQIDCTYSQP